MKLKIIKDLNKKIIISNLIKIQIIMVIIDCCCLVIVYFDCVKGIVKHRIKDLFKIQK
jgi:hypothetical protein